MILDKVEEEVLGRIKPKPSEYKLVLSSFARIRRVVEEVLAENSINALVTLQGSVAHDTWLSGERDLDIFVLFPLSWPVEKLKSDGFSLLLEAARRLGKYSVRYAEHPYVRVSLNGVEADLVPAYRVEKASDIRTAVDRTPLHTRYVLQSLSEDQRDHVRLLKRFFKGIGVYGAEIRIRGFSGYLTELLIIHYGSFHRAIEAASKWREPVWVNTVGDRKFFEKIRYKLVNKYRDSVLYVPDPVDPLRNTAAAVSRRSLAIFTIASSCYLKHKCIEYFFPSDPGISLRQMPRDRCILIIEVEADLKDIPPEVLWGEAYRVLDRATSLVRSFGFNPIDWDCWSDEESRIILALEMEECILPSIRDYTGPPYFSSGRVLDFIVKHLSREDIGPWIRRDATIHAIGRRKYSDAVSLLRDRWKYYMVSPHFRDIRPTVYRFNGVLPVDNDLRQWLRKFIVKRPAWMNCCTG